jgi:hypothetical protein
MKFNHLYLAGMGEASADSSTNQPELCEFVKPIYFFIELFLQQVSGGLSLQTSMPIVLLLSCLLASFFIIVWLWSIIFFGIIPNDIWLHSACSRFVLSVLIVFGLGGSLLTLFVFHLLLFKLYGPRRCCSIISVSIGLSLLVINSMAG